jgi:hypothetical protein
MKFSFNPPTPSEKDQYPVLDTVVTVNSCWHYLSLLEQFVQTTQDIPEVILQQYLVRAEYRYFDWMSKTSTLKNRKEHVPPVGKYKRNWQLLLCILIYINCIRCCILLASTYAKSLTFL